MLYGGNPNDPSGVPVPLINYSQTFENNPNLAAWTMPSQSHAPWALSTGAVHGGTASLRSGAIGNSQNSAVRFRGFFSVGQLSFWARVDSENCCDRLYVFVDGVQVLNVNANLQWTRNLRYRSRSVSAKSSGAIRRIRRPRRVRTRRGSMTWRSRTVMRKEFIVGAIAVAAVFAGVLYFANDTGEGSPLATSAGSEPGGSALRRKPPAAEPTPAARMVRPRGP